MTIVPAIDILGGKCVRLTKGDYSTGRIYGNDPVSIALTFQENGLKRLHVVDLDGAGGDHTVNLEVLRRICTETSLAVDFGGGIKSDEDIESAFDAGASMVTVGSVAATDTQLACRWIERYGPDRLILGADARDGKIATKGWKEDSGLDLLEFISFYHARGLRRVICTDINLDGTLQGPSTLLYKDILKHFPDLLLAASGGVSSVSDLVQLEKAGLDSAIVGKAFYEGRISISEMSEINSRQYAGETNNSLS